MTADTASSSTSPPSSIEDLRAEVAETRERLGQTVACLAAKADVKARAQHKAQEVRQDVKIRAQHAAQEVRQSVADNAQRGVRMAKSTGEEAAHAATTPKVQATVGATALALFGLVWWATRRRR